MIDRDDPLARAVTFEEAMQIAEISRTQLYQWIADGRVHPVDGRILERELVDVEAERHRARRRGCPGARPRRRRLTA